MKSKFSRLLRACQHHFSNPRLVAVQALFLAFVSVVFYWGFDNASYNLDKRGLSLGLGFLGNTAGFAIGESTIPYSPSESNAKALLVGAVNTIWIVIIGCFLTTIVGIVAGLCRLSPNQLLAKIFSAYVELGRNVPILLQLLFWYSLITRLGGPRSAIEVVPGFYISNRGLQIPALVHSETTESMLTAFCVGLGVLVALLVWRRIARNREVLTNAKIFFVTVLAVLVSGWASGARMEIQIPVLQGFNYVGGMAVSPEFAALLFGLTFYSAAFVAEIVRGGILSIPKGQWEASKALGLSDYYTFTRIILPQVIRSILPPLTSQYINLSKNSSIAVAIGYPDLVNVANTTINQTGRAAQIVLLMMGFYLLLSLSISSAANWYGRRLKRRGGER